jgi:hypothetical protein
LGSPGNCGYFGAVKGAAAAPIADGLLFGAFTGWRRRSRERILIAAAGAVGMRRRYPKR